MSFEQVKTTEILSTRQHFSPRIFIKTAHTHCDREDDTYSKCFLFRYWFEIRYTNINSKSITIFSLSLFISIWSTANAFNNKDTHFNLSVRFDFRRWNFRLIPSLIDRFPFHLLSYAFCELNLTILTDTKIDFFFLKITYNNLNTKIN